MIINGLTKIGQDERAADFLQEMKALKK